MTCKHHSLEFSQGSGFRVESRDSFDEACDSKSIANAAVTTNQAEVAAFAGKLDGDSNQSGKAGAVDLRRAVEVDDHFARAALDDRLQSTVKLIGGFTDGEAPVNLNNRNAARIPDVDFHRQVYGHLRDLANPLPLQRGIPEPQGIIRCPLTLLQD
jgi:hypothetical protein